MIIEVHELIRKTGRFRKSRFLRDAFWTFAFNISSRGLLFFGMAHAARCLGPTNLGISAQVQLLSQQVALGFNGGIDSIGLRVIANDRTAALSTLSTALNFRLGIALVLSLVWVILALALFDVGPLRDAWMLGAALLLIASLNTTFVFQGIGRLPVYSAVTGIGTVAMALIYLLLFFPGMRLGSDLVVVTAISSASGIVALMICKRVVPSESLRFSLFSQEIAWTDIRKLLSNGWRFWLLAIVIYVYAGFPLLLVSHFHGDKAAGIFRAALLMSTAIELLFGSINNLLLAKLVVWRKDGARALWEKQSSLARLHVGIGAFVGIVTVTIAPYFFARFLGNQFAASVLVFQSLVVGRIVVFVGQIYAFGLIALELDEQLLRATLFGAGFSVAANLLLIPHYGAEGAAVVGFMVEVVICVQYYLLEKSHVSSTAA